MYPIRNSIFYSFLLGILFAPLFLLAQTATTTSTTTPEITPEQIALQKKIDELTQKRTDVFLPKPAAISANLILQNLAVKVSPENPAPFEQITVTIESYSEDLDRASISWSLDGHTVLKGTGKRTFSFPNGPAGKTTFLSIYITTQNGESLTKNLSWTPLGLTLMWQADTYTPPFYRGKALLSPQASVRVVAIPDNTSGTETMGSGGLAYVWQKDGLSVTSASGFGRNSFSFPGALPYEQPSVSVIAASLSSQASTKKSLVIALSQPQILFYEKTPLLGVWYNTPLGSSFNLSKKEFSISAEPYYFSNETSDIATLKYSWAVNGNTTNNFGHTITLRNDAGAQGDSLVSLSVTGIKKIFQDATQSLTVHFANSEEAAGNATF